MSNKRYQIVNVSVENMGGGPDLAAVCGEVEVLCEGEKFWLFLSEVDGCPTFYRVDKSVMEKLHDDAEQPDISFFLELYENHGLPYEGYEDFFAAPVTELTPLLRYLIWLVRCSWEDAEEWMQTTRGKFADELDIPVSDVEEEWLDEQDE